MSLFGCAWQAWLSSKLPGKCNGSFSGKRSYAGEESLEEVSMLLCLTLHSSSGVLGFSILGDRLFYGTWTFPPLKFLYFNIVESLAVFYGRNDWHYYLSQGLPLLLTTALPFTIAGLYRALLPRNSRLSSRQLLIKRQLALVCLFMPFVLSLIAHKEVRFIYPLLPALHVLTSEPLVSFFLPAISNPSGAYEPRRLALLFLLLVNIFVAYYTSMSHASGPQSVLSYLREQHQAHHDPSHIIQPPLPLLGPLTHEAAPGGAPKNMTVGFLMPCHSTPWRSHLVFPSIHAWALSCEPPVGFNESQRSTYLDEADQFYESPGNFLHHNMVGGLGHIPRKPSYLLSGRPQSAYGTHSPKDGGPPHEWPDYLVFFAQLEPTLNSLLRSSSYAECWRTWNTAWHDDWRRRGDIVVWCLDPAEQRNWRNIHTKRVIEKRDQQFDRIVQGIKKEGAARGLWGSRKQSSSLWRWWPFASSSSSRRKPSLSWPWKKPRKTSSRFLPDFHLPSSWQWPWSSSKKAKKASSRKSDDEDLWS
jgi:phosphatidylinositol glycan class B